MHFCNILKDSSAHCNPPCPIRREVLFRRPRSRTARFMERCEENSINFDNLHIDSRAQVRSEPVQCALLSKFGADLHAYPNIQISRRIEHSTYMSFRSYFTILNHIQRVWHDRRYDGGLGVDGMVDVIRNKFGPDLEPFEDLGQVIPMRWGVRAAAPNGGRRVRRRVEEGQQTLDQFIIG